MPDEDIQIALKLLCSPQNQILNRESLENLAFNDEEKVKVVETFENGNIKVVFTPPKTKNFKEEENDFAVTQQLNEKIVNKKIIQIEIIRIMKARKIENHLQIVKECVNSF